MHLSLRALSCFSRIRKKVKYIFPQSRDMKLLMQLSLHFFVQATSLFATYTQTPENCLTQWRGKVGVEGAWPEKLPPYPGRALAALVQYNKGTPR